MQLAPLSVCLQTWPPPCQKENLPGFFVGPRGSLLVVLVEFVGVPGVSCVHLEWGGSSGDYLTSEKTRSSALCPWKFLSPSKFLRARHRSADAPHFSPFVETSQCLRSSCCLGAISGRLVALSNSWQGVGSRCGEEMMSWPLPLRRGFHAGESM